MEPLTNENFFDEVNVKYPNAAKQFYTWLFDYKRKNNWNNLFNSNSDYQNSDGKNAIAPQFHELPYAFQSGIIKEFAAEIGESTDSFRTTFNKHIIEMFKCLEEDSIAADGQK